jgi:hypothetical protein
VVASGFDNALVMGLGFAQMEAGRPGGDGDPVDPSPYQDLLDGGAMPEDFVRTTVKAAQTAASVDQAVIADDGTPVSYSLDDDPATAPIGGDTDNPFNITDKQFGEKIKDHMSEWGLDVTSSADRLQMRAIINDIAANPDQRVPGTFRGQGSGGLRGDVVFLIKGDDVVITKPDGEFISVMKDGLHNSSVIDALPQARP